MKNLDLSKIKLSFKDKIKKLKFPKKMNEKLAEDIGIHIGDGSMYITGSSKQSYEIKCSGHPEDDKEHYLNTIIPLKEELFNIKIKPKLFKPKKTDFGFVICSKALFYFYNKVIGIPAGNKTKICKIPDIIMKSEDKIKIAFLRGLADTDFSLTFKSKSKKHNLHTYPLIFAGFASNNLINDLKDVLSDLNFTFCYCSYFGRRYDKLYLKYVINLNGVENLEKWMKLIGFNNQKHLTKYLI
ncbi:MAG: hypothetical protein ACE5J4_01845 [Candidatus Aenigmatarchaeota archaeon]